MYGAAGSGAAWRGGLSAVHTGSPGFTPDQWYVIPADAIFCFGIYLCIPGTYRPVIDTTKYVPAGTTIVKVRLETLIIAMICTC